LEYLKKQRSNWEAIYNYMTTTDAAATLELVEEANKKVEGCESAGRGAFLDNCKGLL
jgi:hypothetical protein